MSRRPYRRGPDPLRVGRPGDPARALWTLHAIGGLDVEHGPARSRRQGSVRPRLDDPAPLRAGGTGENPRRGLPALAKADPSPVVRLYLAGRCSACPSTTGDRSPQPWRPTPRTPPTRTCPICSGSPSNPWPRRTPPAPGTGFSRPHSPGPAVPRPPDRRAGNARGDWTAGRGLGGDIRPGADSIDPERPEHGASGDGGRWPCPRAGPGPRPSWRGATMKRSVRKARALSLTFGDPAALQEARQRLADRRGSLAERRGTLEALLKVHDPELAATLQGLLAEPRAARRCAPRPRRLRRPEDAPADPRALCRGSRPTRSATR